MDEKGNWSPSDMLNNRNNWSLADDAELLKHLHSLSEKLFNKSRSTLNLLQSFENDVSQTCVAVANINNRFKALSDTQFIESKIEESPETEITETKENETPKNPVKENITDKLKEALDNGINVLESHYDVIAVTDSDSESEEPPEVLLKARNPYMSRRLPYIIGTDNFNKYDHLGLVDTSSEEEDAEQEEEEEEGEENESEKENEESKITPKAVRIEADLHRPLTQVIRISSSDSEDSDVSLRQNKYGSSGDIPRFSGNDTPALKPELKTPMQQTPFSFADHLNATLQNASSHINRDTDLPSHDDIFAPPPFPSKDINSYSSDEEKSDESSDDMFVSKSQQKKSDVNYNLPKSQPPAEDSDDNDDWMTASSHNTDTYSRKPFSTKSANVHIPADVPVSNHPPAVSETSQMASSSPDKQNNNVGITSIPTTKNVQNKKMISAINAELAAKLKIQKNPMPDNTANSSEDDDAKFQSSIISSSNKKKNDLVEDNNRNVKPNLFDNESKPVEHVSSAPKSKTTLNLFDDEDDDAVYDLFKPAAKTNITKVDDRKTNKGLFDDRDDLFVGDTKSHKSAEKTVKPSAIGNITAIKKDLFGDDSDSGDDIFTIINSQKKSTILSPKPTESSNKTTATSTRVSKADESLFAFGKKTAGAVPSVPQKIENLFEGEKVESVTESKLDVKTPGQRSQNETYSSKSKVKNATLFGDDEDDDSLFAVAGRSAVAEAPNVPQRKDDVNESKSSIIGEPVRESHITVDNSEKHVKNEKLFNEDDSGLRLGAQITVDATENITKTSKNLFDEVESDESENDESMFEAHVRESRGQTQSLEKNTKTNKNLFAEDGDETIVSTQSTSKKNKNLFEDDDESEFNISKNEDSIFSKSVLETKDKVDDSKKTSYGLENDVKKEDVIGEVSNLIFDSSNSKPLEKNKNVTNEKPGESNVSEYVKSVTTSVKQEAVINDMKIEGNKSDLYSSQEIVSNRETKSISSSNANPEGTGVIGTVTNQNEDVKHSDVERISKTFGSADERDGNLFTRSALQNEILTDNKPKPGKLTAVRGLNINVNALLPGSKWSAISKQQKENASSPVQESPTNSEPQEPVPNLSSVIKDRAKISTKRRPPSRRARISQISENNLFAGAVDSDQHQRIDDIPQNSPRDNLASSVSLDAERTSPVIAKQPEKKSFEGLSRNDEKRNEESVENMSETTKKENQQVRNTKVTTNSSASNVAGSTDPEEYPKNDTESKESSHHTSNSIDRRDQTNTEPDDNKPVSNLTSLIKDRARLPNRRPPTRKQPIRTDVEETRTVIPENVPSDNVVVPVTHSTIENSSSTVKPFIAVEDAFSLPKTKDPPAPKSIDINKLFEDSDDDEDDDIFSKLIVKDKKQPERKESDPSLSATSGGPEFDNKKIVNVKQKADSAAVPSVTEDLFSSAERKGAIVFGEETKSEGADLFSSAKVASSSSGTENALKKSSMVSLGPPLTKEKTTPKMKDLFADDSDEESDIFAKMTKSKTFTVSPQTTTNIVKEVKSVEQTRSSPSPTLSAQNKPNVDLFGEEEDELFSKPKKLLTKSALPKRSSLFDDNDDDNDLFGVKTSASGSKSKDSLQKSKTAPKAEKQRVVKLRSETVVKDPLSGK